MSIFTNDYGDIRWGWIVAPIAVLIIILVGWFWYYTHGTQRTVQFHVNKTERITKQNSSKYLVYTDHGVFEDTDSFLRLKFNSSDIYNQLENGKDYTCLVYGWRIPLFSTQPNIVKCDS